MIGSEHTIMERAEGRELVDTWYTMTFKERMAMIEKMVEIESILLNIKFPANGSLFFRDTLNTGARSVNLPGNSSSNMWIGSVSAHRPSIFGGIKSEMSLLPIVDLVRTLPIQPCSD